MRSSFTPDRSFLALACCFVLSRVAYVLCGADLLSEPDAAEVKLMAWGDQVVRSGWPGWGEWLRMIRSGPMAPHGGTWFVTACYTALATILERAGSYAALKAVAIVLQTAGFVGWVGAARALAGERTAWVLGGLLLLAPAGMLGPSLVPWGSHPEAAALLGLPLLWAARGGGGVGLALAFGLVASLDLLVVPAALVLLGSTWRAASPIVRLRDGVAFFVPIAAMVWLTGIFSSSVTEDPVNTPSGLLAGVLATSPELLVQTLAAVTDLRSWSPLATPSGWWPTLHSMDRVTAALLLLAAILGAYRHPRLRPLLLAAGVQGIVLLLLAPRRPELPPRYLLLPWTLLITVGAARPLLLLPQAAAGLLLAWTLCSPSRAPMFATYDPPRWVPHDLGHLRYEDGPAVDRFLEARAEDPAGFEIVTGSGAAEAALVDPPRRDFSADAVIQRLEAVGPRLPPPGPRRKRRMENLGWALFVLGREDPAEVRRVLISLREDRWDAARGFGMAAGHSVPCGVALLAPPDREVEEEGRASERTRSGLPPCP